MDTLLSTLQWPAMAASLVAAWLVASRRPGQRAWGFWCFIGSNLLWTAWGWHEQAYALIALQAGLFVLNLRGAKKTDTSTASKSSG